MKIEEPNIIQYGWGGLIVTSGDSGWFGYGKTYRALF
jgi:hypothetical protein